MSFLHSLPPVVQESIDTTHLDNIDTYASYALLNEVQRESIVNFDKIYYCRLEGEFYRYDRDTETFEKIIDLTTVYSNLSSLWSVMDTKYAISEAEREHDILNTRISNLTDVVGTNYSDVMAAINETGSQKHDKADFEREKGILDTRISDFTEQMQFLINTDLNRLWTEKQDKIGLNSHLPVKVISTHEIQLLDFNNPNEDESIVIRNNQVFMNNTLLLDSNMLTIPSISTEMITVGNIMLNTSITNNEVSTSVIKCKYGEVDILFGENSKSIVNKGYVDNLVSTSISGIQTLVGSRNITIENGVVTLNGTLSGLYSIGCSIVTASSQVKIGDNTNGMTIITNDMIDARTINANTVTITTCTSANHATNKSYVDTLVNSRRIEAGNNIALSNGGLTVSLRDIVTLTTQTLFDGSMTLRLSGNGLVFESSDNNVTITKTGSDFKLHPRITRDEHVDVLEEMQLITKKNLYQSIYRNDAYDSRLLNVNDVQVAVFGINFDTTIENSYKTTYELIATYDKTTTSLFQPNADSVRRPISRPCSLRIATIFGNIIELNLHLIINSQTLPVGMKTDFAYIRLGLLFKQTTGFLQYWSNVGDTYSTIYSELEELQTHSDTFPYIETMQFVTTTNTTTQSVVKIGNGLVFLNSNIAKTDLSSSEYRVHGNDICRLR